MNFRKRLFRSFSRLAKPWQLGLVLLSALLLFLSQPDPNIGWLAWVALVPLNLALLGWRHGQDAPRSAFFLGWLAGSLFYGAGVCWLHDTMTVFGNMSWLAATAALLLLASYMGLYTGLYGWAVRLACSRGRRFPLVVIAPGAWMTGELLRATVLSGFPWLSVGYSQWQYPGIRDIASLVGVYGLSGGIVLVNAGLSEVLRMHCPKRRLIWTSTFILAGSAILGGLAARGSWTTTPEPRKPIDVAICQGNIPQTIKWDGVYRDYIFGEYERLTRAGIDGGVDLVVWPEAATPFRFRRDVYYADRMRAFARDGNIGLLFGTIDRVSLPDMPEIVYNAALLLDTDGSLAPRYAKTRLVPFGEFVPLGPLLFWVDKFVYEPADFTPGPNLLPVPFRHTKLGVNICYEVVFPDIIRTIVKNGADILVNMSNEAWFGKSAATRQMISMSVMRCVETRTPLVRAANTGISTVIKPNGTISFLSDLERTQVFIERVTPRSGPLTLYTRWGNWLPIGWGVVSMAFVLIAWLRRGVGN